MGAGTAKESTVADETEVEKFREGVQAMQAGNVQMAIDRFTAVLEIDSNSVDALFYRGACYFHLKDWENTIADYSKILTISPTSKYFMARGEVYFAKGDFESAAKDFESVNTATDKPPKNTSAAAKFNLGTCCYKLAQSSTEEKQSKLNRAQTYIEEAIALDNKGEYRAVLEDLKKELSS